MRGTGNLTVISQGCFKGAKTFGLCAVHFWCLLFRLICDDLRLTLDVSVRNAGWDCERKQPERKCNFKGAGMCMGLKVTKGALGYVLNPQDLIFCVTSFLTRSFNALPLSYVPVSLSLCLQRSGRGLAVFALKTATPRWTRLWSSWAPRSLMRGSTSATSAPSPQATLTEKCHSSCGVSPSLMTLPYSKKTLAQFISAVTGALLCSSHKGNRCGCQQAVLLFACQN